MVNLTKPSAIICRLPSVVWLFLGALCYYLALPPVNFAPLALAVPICWGIVILAQERGGISPPVQCPLVQCPSIKWYWIYLTAFLFWLASIWWVACPYPPLTALGMFALVVYLSLYWVLFFVSARVAVHRFRIPLLVAMPVCWIGTEYWRCNVVLGGFSFCSLEHAFYQYPILIQFASIGGSLLVGGIIMLIGAAFVTMFSRVTKPHNVLDIIAYICIPSLPLLICIGGLRMMLVNIPAKGDVKYYTIVALQGDRQIRLTSTPKEIDETFQQFRELTYQAAGEKPDLIIWPETVCPIPVLLFEGSVTPADVGLTDEEATSWETEFCRFVQHIETPVIFGLSTYIFKDDPEKPIRLNSALLVEPHNVQLHGGDELGKIYRYDKMHLVMFGEYIPFTEYLPDNFFLKTLCPEAEHGSKPVAFPIGARSVGQGSEPIMTSVNICFESTIAPLIRRQILTLRKEGHDPRVLINLSNDGWFRFSQQIEQHLATHVFRAVENGMWYATATNGAFSAIIQPNGTIASIGKRGTAESVAGTISVDFSKEHADTFYLKYGDWYALLFGLIVLGLAVEGVRRQKSGDRINNRAGESE